MTADGMERRLQDYLDGRLSPDETLRLEAKLREDPELTARLRAAREVRHALAAGDETLSPGFYTRARAEFEERSPAARRFRGFRWLSWEAVGLAGAAMLALVVFGPFFTGNRMDTPRGPGSGAGSGARALQGERAKVEAVEAVEGPSVEEVRGTAERAPSEKKRQVASADGKEAEGRPIGAGKPKTDRGFADADAPSTVPRLDAAVPPPTAPARAETIGDRRAAPMLQAEESHAGQARAAPAPAPADDAEDDRFAPEPRSFAEEAVPGPSEAQGGREVDALRKQARARGSVTAGDLEQRVVVGSELPRGIVEAGSLRVVDDAAEIAAILSRTALAGDATIPAETRVVLVGARDDLRCDMLAIDTEGEQHVLSFAPLPGQGSPGGCVVTVPRDGRAVVLRDRRSARP